jgi:hypothetical protein
MLTWLRPKSPLEAAEKVWAESRTRDRRNTITLPSGSTETETYEDVVTGHRTVENGTIHAAGGGVQTWTSVAVKQGL